MASSQGSGTNNGLSLFFSQWFNLFRPKLPVFLSPIYPIYLDSIYTSPFVKKLKTTIICLCVNFFILITVPDHQIVINILIMYKISPTLKICGKLRRASISGRMLLHSRMIKGESIRDVWRETTFSYTRAWGDSTS